MLPMWWYERWNNFDFYLGLPHVCFLSVDWSKQRRKISCVCTILIVAELFLAVLALCKLILIAC